MRFHVVGLPHANTTLDFTACAFTENVRKFAIMMKSLNHEVFLYGGEFTDAPCDENIMCISEQERLDSLEGKHYSLASFDYALPHWVKFNNTAIEEMAKRIQPKDFICVIGGRAHKVIADAFPENMTVEFEVGYGGTFAKYKVFESYAWMHVCYGAAAGNPNDVDGQFYDDVIPGHVDIRDFPFRETPDDYYLFIGRLIDRKGYQVAVDVCRRLGKRLIVAGQGTVPDYGEYVGVVGTEERARLMGGAIASFVPTIYTEPFGLVVAEAMACGTPVITTDWGAFPENVIQGVNGFRCRTLRQFIDAAQEAPKLDRKAIREYAVARFGLETNALLYEKYFNRLLTLWGKGFYELGEVE
jgi:glycosyltransferase involved in cell wall biosynthesis